MPLVKRVIFRVSEHDLRSQRVVTKFEARQIKQIHHESGARGVLKNPCHSVTSPKSPTAAITMAKSSSPAPRLASRRRCRRR